MHQSNLYSIRTVAITFGLPRETVQSKRPSRERGFVGEAGIMARGSVCAWACAGVGTFVGKGKVFMWGNYGRGLCGEGAFVPYVYCR